MWDESHPGYRKRSSQGEVIMSPMTRIKTVIDRNPITLRESRFMDGGSYIPDGAGSFVPTESYDFTLNPPDHVRHGAVQRAYQGISINDVNAVQWIGEAKECITMFWEAGEQLLRLLRMTQRQRARWAQGLLKPDEIRKMFLTIQYGILPIEQQIQQMGSLFKSKKPQRYTSRGYGSWTDAMFTQWSEPFANWGRIVRVYETCDYVVRAGYLYDVDVTGLSPLEVAGFTPENFISAAWALSRLSFVIDWFITVGPTIAAWSPKTGCHLLGGWYTENTTREINLLDEHYPVIETGETSQSVQGGGSFRVRRTITTRVLNNEVPLLPTLDVNLNASKILSLIALFAKFR